MAGGSSHHGNTPAAWTAVATIFLGSVVAAVALPFALPWLFFTGLAIMVLGAVAGKVLQLMGFGRPAPAAPEEAGRADEAAYRSGAPEAGSSEADRAQPASDR
jgi:hypothetical protein